MKIQIIGSQIVIGVALVVAVVQANYSMAILFALFLVLIELTEIRRAIEAQGLQPFRHTFTNPGYTKEVQP